MPDFFNPFLRNGKMALIRFGGGVVQMSGSIGGDTFARNRFGNYNRARTKPTNPNTARQMAIRSALSQLTARWSQIVTAGQRTAWNLYAANVAMKNRLGEVIHLTGFNHYLRSNIYRLDGDRPVVDDGPVIFELPEQDPTIAITASEGTGHISLTFDDTMPWCSEEGSLVIIGNGQPQNAQRNFFAGPYHSYGRMVGDAVTPPTSPLDADYWYGIAEGQHLWIKLRISRADGRLSEAFRTDCFCAA